MMLIVSLQRVRFDTLGLKRVRKTLNLSTIKYVEENMGKLDVYIIFLKEATEKN